MVGLKKIHTEGDMYQNHVGSGDWERKEGKGVLLFDCVLGATTETPPKYLVQTSFFSNVSIPDIRSVI